ncbi:MAG TPA: RedB protein [Myxococcales bacterium]|nr:RedB protein [Myxococcales bacterium]
MPNAGASPWARHSPLLLAAGAAWLLAVSAGFAFLWRYKSTPGAQGDPTPATWPAHTGVARSSSRATLLMFAHPGCTCTRASIAELAWIMNRFHDRLDASVLFWSPRDAPRDWQSGDGLWASAARIPRVSVLRDRDGREASRFGVTTSGAVLLYDSGGRLLFKGGITSARGHEGDSFGRERIASLLTTGAADRADAPVFGCALGAAPAEGLAQAGSTNQTERSEK